jgi:hypothetical protein
MATKFGIYLMGICMVDANEVEIAREGGLKPIIEGARSESIELQSQVARALRNLSVNRKYFLHQEKGTLILITVQPS